MSRQISSEDFPVLHRGVEWGEVRCSFQLQAEIPSPPLIANVNVIPTCGEKWLLLRLADGSLDIPGGTLEPGESYLDTLQRELLEEAGALLKSFRPFGFFRCRSSAARPFRPHLPHPEFIRLVGVGEVEVVASPSNPTGGEQVAAIELLPLADAIRRLRSLGREDLAELYLLAARLS